MSRPPEPVPFTPTQTRVLGRATTANTSLPLRKRIVRYGVASIALLAILIAALTLHAATSRPAWFDQTEPSRWLDDAPAVAVAVENGVTSELTRKREPGVVWTLRLTEAEANAWLTERLRLWAERESPGSLPAAVRRVAVDLRRDAIVLAVDHAERPGAIRRERDILAVTLQPAHTGGANAASLRPVSVGINRLTVPASLAPTLAPLVGSAAGEGSPLDALLRGEGGPFDNAIALSIGDGRRAVLRNARITEGEIELTFTTEPR